MVDIDITDPVQLEEILGAVRAAKSELTRESDDRLSTALVVMEVGVKTLLGYELERHYARPDGG